MSLDTVTEYALSFSGEAVHLQQRPVAAQGEGARHSLGWRHLGSVDFDDPAFRDALSGLRRMALGEAGDASDGKAGDGSLPVTLVIPDDQILYTTLTVAGSVDRQHAVGRALDGLTPYAIEELAFDWDGDGDTVRVAAVARQTLREARDFAAQYGFDGQSFCADPDGDLFPGQPVFVLDPPVRRRPVVDPALAGVTAAALMFDDEAKDKADPLAVPGTPDAEPKPEPEAQATDAAPEAVAAVSSAPHAPAIPPEDRPDLELPGETPVADLPAKDSPAADPSKTPAPEDVPAALAGAAPDAPVPPEPEAKAAAVAAVGPAVVRHPRVEPAQPLNPRAKAVHDRAAEARQSRSAGAAPASPDRAIVKRGGGLTGLVAMLGALVLGLVVIWAFVVPESGPAQIAETQTQPEATPAPEVGAETLPDPAQSGGSQAAVEPSQTDPLPDSQTPTAQQTVAPQTAASQTAEVAPAAPEPATAQPDPAPQIAPRSALTEAEARRVVIAAAAVAAAVVPPTSGSPVPNDLASAAGAVTAAPVPTPAPAASGAPTAATPTAIAPARPQAAPQPARTQAAAPRSEPRAAPAPTRQASAPAATTAQPQTLRSSARPQLAPRRTTPQTTRPEPEAAPRVPGNPLPYAASQRPTQPTSSARPPSRARSSAAAPAAAAPAQDERRAETAPTPVSAQPVLRGSMRPPARPEGSAPDLIAPEGDADLTPADRSSLDALIRDMSRYGLAGPAMPQMATPGARLADARPTPRPQGHMATDAVAPSAVEAALRSASTAPPPDKPATSASTAAPARDPGGLLRGSARPTARPGNAVSASAVESAVASAVEAAPATAGAVQLATLRSSPLPPRRDDDAAPAAAAASARPDPAPDAAPAAAATAAAAPGPSDAEQAARRALDEQLQSQAEARIRARAQADAAAEAQARAQAEARARAQAAAEERQARANRQDYKPPEVDNEPEVAANMASGGVTAASVAKSATQSRGMNTSRTTIIGIIGAGNASRALIRLRNGKIVTVRMGDRIDGGTINSIGDGKLTYVKSGQQRELRMLDGR
ncbi:hypothetical protein [Paracoccus shanxieyensis]|uniref:Translation initiation factor 2 n=1 Tax=Paracoccus shanxieyensis TaxID=2675752 RepID=A0A6L6IYK3_9RHOB|nr:hypothetical protein [Paracoccus shanxieyensis]MTH64658.1 hypothetical protein [Paracoccus shanxieyensis]MTH87802.1 hypothetical protein [Paracoccus shanxieyensis]